MSEIQLYSPPAQAGKAAEGGRAEALLAAQKEYYASGATRSVIFRKNMLRKLKRAIVDNDELICSALMKDLHKHPYETYMCETGLVLDEINYHLDHLYGWTGKRRVRSAMAQLPAKCFTVPEPYGSVLIMAPWNYPVQLCFMPLVGAISAGNCAVIKPSAYAPNSSHAIRTIIESVFPPEYVAVVEGGRDENKALLDADFDYIFFTGSVNVGKTVMESASSRLIPVTLELGGKSPVIVDETANLHLAARKIAFGKVLNAGQTCVAPDYLLIHESVKERFIEEYRSVLGEFFPNGDMSDMVHIINKKHFDRLCGVLESGRAVLGGGTDPESRFIEPTLLTELAPDSPAMNREIFGPILPVIGYSDLGECIEYIRARPKPLALYFFSQNTEAQNRVLDSCSFGGGCINDTIMHIASSNAAFGGVGASGMGSYHGKQSFDTFSHRRTVLANSFPADVPVRYFPYTEKKAKLVKKMLG